MSDRNSYNYNYYNNYRRHRRARSLPSMSNNRLRSHPYRRHASVSPPRRSSSSSSPSPSYPSLSLSPSPSISPSTSSPSSPSEPSPAYVPLPVPLAPIYRSQAIRSPQVYFAPLSPIYIPLNTNNQNIPYDYASRSLQDAVVYNEEEESGGDYDQVVPDMDN